MPLKQYLTSKRTEIASYFRRNYSSIMIVIIFICVFALLGYAINGQRIDTELVKKQDEQIQEVKKLGEVNKKLIEENVYLADRGIFYSKCIARIIAEFTQNTSDPITIEDISKCDFEARGKKFTQSFEPTINSERNLPSALTGEPDKNSPKTEPDNPGPPPSPPPNRSPLDRLIDILPL